jgi:hypothetical protein
MACLLDMRRKRKEKKKERRGISIIKGWDHNGILKKNKNIII